MELMNLRYLLLLLTVLVGRARTRPDESPCPFDVAEPAPDGARVVDGNLLAGRPERSYPPSQYRRQAVGTAGGEYLLCPCAIKQCMRKCCKPGMVFAEKGCSAPPEGATVNVENFAVPKFVNGNETIETYETGKFHMVYGKAMCLKNGTRKYLLRPFQSKQLNFRVSETGWLLNGTTGFNLAPAGLFCLERFSYGNFQIAAVVCVLTGDELKELNGTVALGKKEAGANVSNN